MVFKDPLPYLSKDPHLTTSYSFIECKPYKLYDAKAQLQSQISRALDDKNYYVLSSLDLSSAFDIVNQELLYKRMEIFGMPDDIMQLISNQ